MTHQQTSPNEKKSLVDTTGECFELLDKLGEGAAGVIFKARQQSLDRLVAIKLLKLSTASSIERMRKEATAMAKLNHPNILQVHRFCVTEANEPFIVIDLIEGETLADHLHARGPLKISELREIFSQLLSALSAAHSSGFIHRDIKPSNIMLAKNGRAKLMDFGLVKDTRATAISQTQSNAILGTALYMSPEQCFGQPVDARSDLYSMGSVMFECLTGTPLMVGESLLEIGMMRLNQSIALNVDQLPPESIGILSKALARNPDDRFQSADEFADKLNSIGEDTIEQKKRRVPIRLVQVAGLMIFLAVAAVCVLRTATPPTTTTKSEDPRLARIRDIVQSAKLEQYRNSTLPKRDRIERNLAAANQLRQAINNIHENANWQNLAAAWEILGNLDRGADLYMEAANDFTQANKFWVKEKGSLYPTAVGARCCAAACYASAGRWPEANEQYAALEQEVKSNPLSTARILSQVYITWAASALSAAEWKKAKQLADKSIQAYSDDNWGRCRPHLRWAQVNLIAAAHSPDLIPSALLKTKNVESLLPQNWKEASDEDFPISQLIELTEISCRRMSLLESARKQADCDREYQEALARIRSSNTLPEQESSSVMQNVKIGLLKNLKTYYGSIVLARAKPNSIRGSSSLAREAGDLAVQQGFWQQAQVTKLKNQLDTLSPDLPKDQLIARYKEYTKDLASETDFSQ